VRGPLAILLAVAAVQFAAWLVVLPPLQAPDESAHFAYAQHLVETGHRPPVEGEGQAYSPELQTARLDAGLGALVGNLSARPYWTRLDERLWSARDAALGPAARIATGPDTASRNPPLSYLYSGIGYGAAHGGSLFDRLYAMRLLNLPLYLLTIWLTWWLAGELLGPAPWPRTVAAGAVAVLPQFAFVAAGISPDPLLTVIWAAFTALAVRTVRAGPTAPRAAGLAGLALASVLTHPRGVPLAFLAVLALVLAARRRLPRRLLVPGVVAAGLALAAIVAAVVAGGVLDSTAGAHFSVRQFASYVWQFYLPRLPFMSPAIGPDYSARTAFIETFYGVFASLEVRWPAAVYDVLELFTFAGLGALAGVLIRARARLRGQWPVVVLLAAMPVTLVAALHFAAYRNLQIDPTDPIIVGRYLFPLLPLFGVAVAIVVAALPRRASVATGTVLLMAGALLSLSGLGMTAVRFYV
jgi:hypothetical protein